jgi:hypothetical protein
MKSTAARLLSTPVVLASGIASAVYARGRTLRERLVSVGAEFAASARALAETASLAEAEAPAPEGEPEKAGLFGLSGVALALVIGAVVLLCVLPLCVVIILALLGPAIGNVFSDIVEEI